MKIVASLIIGFIVLCSASVARAEPICQLRKSTVHELEAQFKEKVSGRGLTANGNRMVELFVSSTGSWTILVTDTDGRSCLMAEGKGWHGIKILVGEPI